MEAYILKYNKKKLDKKFFCLKFYFFTCTEKFFTIFKFNLYNF